MIPLAFHVDYWDRLGWRDPYSSPAWSRRQMFYARAVPFPTPYTPQVIVDGRRTMVGSNGGAIATAIEADSQQNRPAGTLRVTLARNGGSLNAVIHAEVASRNDVDVMLAVVQDEATTKVANGENGGRTLMNAAIVRHLVRAGTIRSGAFDKSVTVPLDGDHVTAVVFLQEHDTLAIHGAASAHL